MTLSRPLRRLAALFAAFGIALQALWPLIAQAAPAERTLVAALCSVEHGGQQVSIKLGKAPVEERAAQAGEHCKLCFFGAEKPVLPVDWNAAKRLPEAIADPIGGVEALSFRSFPVLSARPRAPPHAS